MLEFGIPALIEIPDDAPTDWKGVFTFGQPPANRRGSLMLPLEGRRWIVTIAGAKPLAVTLRA